MITGSLLVPRRQLHLGPLLAEGGEGRVYEVADHPEQVYKAYRVGQPSAGLVELVAWSGSLEGQAPALQSRVRASAAWPLAVVVEGSADGGGRPGEPGGHGAAQTAAGLLLPRAPRRFSLRHRDGRSHLSSLSYLTADPARRSAAYGIDLPEPMSPERLGLVYALARLLEAFESASPRIVHGDLSAKNVLWSLARGPEVFVIDCDNAARYGEDQPLGPADRRRAMTPNWDDPAIPPGSDPGPRSDRYSLALIFLRVCGAAHYPIQKRQKAGEAISLEMGVPPSARRARSLASGAPLWDLVARGLTAAEPSSRPPAAAWVEALQVVIEDLGATRILDAVGAAQGRMPLSGAVVDHVLRRDAGDVTVAPVAALRPRSAVSASPGSFPAGTAAGWTSGGWTATRSGAGVATTPGGAAPVPGWRGGGGSAYPAPPPATPGPSTVTQARRLFLVALAWLLEEHRRTVRYLRTPARRRRGLLRIPWCVAVDIATGAVVLFLVGMVVSPFLGV